MFFLLFILVFIACFFLSAAPECWITAMKGGLEQTAIITTTIFADHMKFTSQFTKPLINGYISALFRRLVFKYIAL